MSRRYIITVAQRKGGVGKTTLAVCLAAELSNRGNTVVLIDADTQRSASQWAPTSNLQFPVYEVALVDQEIGTWVHQLTQATKFYNFVVIDTAPHEYAVSASVAVSDLVIVPCTPSGLDLNATARTLEIIDMVRARKHGHPSLILVPNRVDARTREGRQIGVALSGFNEVVSPTIGDRAAFVRALSSGRIVAEIPDGLAANREIQILCDFVEKALGMTSSIDKSDNQLSVADD
jgi:chromosome partitioning protein